MQPESGPFKKGERLTAAKLNELATGTPLSVAGGALTHNPRGSIVHIDQPENIYIRLTGKTGTSPIKYAWKEVVRLANGTWLNTPRTANYTDDYAIELNNSNLSTTDNYVYRAERSPHSGEWLFFLRRKATVPSIRIIPQLLSSASSNCTTQISLDGLYASSLAAFSSSAPSEFRVASVTLRVKDYNDNWSTVKTWTDKSDSTWGNYTYTPPYTPSASQPLTFELTGTTANGTLLGTLWYSCPVTSLCGTTLTPQFYDNQGVGQNYFYQAVSANLTSNTTAVTSNITTLVLSIRGNALASVTLPSGAINGPAQYNYQMGWSSNTGNDAGMLSFINANFSSSIAPSGLGASSFSTTTGTYGGVSTTRYGAINIGIGYTVAEDWSTTPVPAWPSPYPTYSSGLLYITATERVQIPGKTVQASQTINYWGNASASFPTLYPTIPTSNTFTDNGGNTYTLNSTVATPSGSC